MIEVWECRNASFVFLNCQCVGILIKFYVILTIHRHFIRLKFKIATKVFFYSLQNFTIMIVIRCLTTMIIRVWTLKYGFNNKKKILHVFWTEFFCNLQVFIRRYCIKYVINVFEMMQTLDKSIHTPFLFSKLQRSMYFIFQ